VRIDGKGRTFTTATLHFFLTQEGMEDKFRDINAMLNGLFPENSQTLRKLFEQKIQALDVSPSVACNILGVQLRAITGILNGTQKTIDITVLGKLSNFLQVPREKIVILYLEAVEKNFPTSTISARKVEFIKENFDLAVLRKARLIDNITDFEHIEKRLTARLGLKSILEYRKPSVDVAFCVGPFKPKNDLTRATWITAAQACFQEIDNPNPYDRQRLINLFPQLRWFTTNVAQGLPEVIQLLYRVGVTIVLQPSLPTLQLRGATFNYNGKPCIALTDYVGFYSTLWFALFHELFHVLFDWDEIKANQYHVTDDDNNQLSVQEREKEANAFAGEYLFSPEKVKFITPYLQDASYVADFAARHQVHPSIVYVQCARALGKNRSAWKLARMHSPSASDCIKKFGVALEAEGEQLIEQLIQPLKASLYF